MNDLEEAIQVSRQAVQATPVDHPDRVYWLNNLGNVLESRYKRTRQIEDLEEAIRVSSQAAQATPNDHPDLAGRLSNLGNKLQSRYEQTRQIEDLEEAIRVSHQAAQATPNEHPDLAMFLNNFGNKLQSRYEQTRQIEHLEEAIRVSRQAIQGTPDEHPDLAMYLNNLGTKLETLYKKTGQMGNLEEAIQVSRRAVNVRPAPPLTRVTAAVLALRLLLERKDYQDGYELSVEAIDILQLVHKRSLTLQDQQYVISHFSGFATQGCALALQTGQTLFTALRLLQRGRGVILSLFMDDRSDTSKLREAHPALCALYESLRLEVNTPDKGIKLQQTGKTISTRRLRALEELEKCIQDIQHLPGFSSFHQGLTAEQMEYASSKGRIIVVNITSIRSDAIIVSPAGFSLVPLPRFSAIQAQRWVDQNLTSASFGQRGVKNKTYRQFLAWLWRECVSPVLTELGCTIQPSTEDLPRVWWIGTGLASSFPFHAAYDISTGENTFCRVLSSYTPSIKALLHAREQAPTSTSSNDDHSKLPMVTMAKTPGANDLPGVEAERSTVLGALGPSVQVEILDQPDSVTVIRRIVECNIAHFACHGTSDSLDPSQSGLLLQTATANPQQDILNVLKLCENRTSHGKIAYLSACSTAENQAESLIDEVLHVVSGFQIAGFRHVIGTLWPSDDSVCVEVARAFYAELCQNGNLEYTDRTIAVALHKAVSAVSMSENYRKRPLHWAQYVHYGA
jgi:tetratricopeptide (TPR) repeat protein